MLTANVEKKPTGTLAVLNGVIDDQADLDALLGPPPKVLRVDCGGVSRVNSVGVKAWFKYFEKARQQGTKLEFVECSPVIVQQLNALMNFACGGRVISFHLSYYCQRCSKFFTESVRSDDVREKLFKVPGATCPTCHQEGTFDELPEEYFSFLKRA
jgi:anti-anti-sigma regulatory factor